MNCRNDGNDPLRHPCFKGVGPPRIKELRRMVEFGFGGGTDFVTGMYSQSLAELSPNSFSDSNVSLPSKTLSNANFVLP